MYQNLTDPASLVFTEDRFVSLSKVSEILTTSLLRVKEVVAAVRAEQKSLRITCDRFCTKIELVYEDRETILSIAVQDRNPEVQTSTETKLAHLAFLCFPLSLNLPATYLLWPKSDIKIPRQRFIEGLADSFSPHKAAHSPPNQAAVAVAIPSEDDLRDLIRKTAARPDSEAETVNAAQMSKSGGSVLERLSRAARPVFNVLH